MMKQQDRKIRRVYKTRTKSKGRRLLPRLSVYRSHKALFVQLIDDSKGVTIVSAHSREIMGSKKRIEQAEKLGEKIAAKALLKKIKEVRYDRGGYKYHGLVKAVAEGARKAGLQF